MRCNTRMIFELVKWLKTKKFSHFIRSFSNQPNASEGLISMIENVIIWGPQEIDNRPTVIQLPSDEHNRVAEKIKALDARWQISMNESYRENSYDNDDYLFVSDLLNDIRELHKKIYYDSRKKKWIKGHREIPYIHLDFVNRSAVKKDERGELVPDDKQLNMGVRRPHFNGTHTLWFNYYWLKRYLVFLQTIFDCNEEEVFVLPSDANVQNQVEYKTKAEITEVAKDLKRKGLKRQAENLMVYANSFLNCDKIKMPCLTFLRVEEEKQVVTWSFYDEDTKSFKMPVKKTIYNTSGFAHLFEERNALVSELFINSLKMILAHETAHVARGHWLLRIKEPEYSKQRNVMMNCEINADWTAAHWLLNELLYDTVDGDPHSNVLAYTKETLIHVMSIRVLSIYLSLSWTQQKDDDRLWTAEILKEFVEKDEATHPIYQFRLFCVLNHIKDQLDHIARQNQKEGYVLITADGKPLCKEMFNEIWRRSCDMIFSFEYAFRTCWNDDERDALEKIMDGLYITENAMPDEKEKVPFFICYMKRAYDELAQYEKQWLEILAKLREYGMFFRM